MRLAIFGGSFDPVHNGHLQSALEIVDQLALQQLRFLPCGKHAFHKSLYFNNDQRVAMLKLAIGDSPQLAIDQREIDRRGVSYSIDSCRELRAEHGNKAQLFFVIGSDLLAGLHRWHEWEALLDYVNIVVIQRAGHIAASAPPVDAAVQALLDSARSPINVAPKAATKGELMLLELKPWPLSSTQVRQQLVELLAAPAEKRAAKTGKLADMLSPAVYEYIIQTQLTDA